MTWHTITHACGHEERHQLQGRSKDRAWRAERLAAEPCHACWKAERAAENAAAAQANARAGLPPLSGSPAQVTWAETIRAKTIEILDLALADRLEGTQRIIHLDDLDPQDPGLPILADALRAQDRASWWIDRRDHKLARLLAELAKDGPREPDPPEGAAAAAIAEATVRPEREITATPAEIRVLDQVIEIRFPERRDDFRELIKRRLRYAWTGTAWARRIDTKAGLIAERAVEAAHRLLVAGFPIRLHDPDLRARAIAGDYRPEQRRWIMIFTSGDHVGQIYIEWPRDDDFYSAAKALPGARYHKPGIRVPASSYEAIEDFATAHGFSIGNMARAALDAARQAHDGAVIATPGETPMTEVSGTGTMPEATGKIDPALLDD